MQTRSPCSGLLRGLLPLLVGPFLLLQPSGAGAVDGGGEGPCTMGTPLASDFPRGTRLKCTDTGYFELVQCTGEFCVCVDPLTGYPARATKSGSSKVVPVCGRCHVQLADFLKRHPGGASQSADEWRPMCEHKQGHFVPKQCIHAEKCFCVAPSTGARLQPGSSFSSSAQLNCELATASTAEGANSPPAPLPTTASGGGGAGGRSGGIEAMLPPPMADPVCALPKARGLTCAKAKREVKWYYDGTTHECLAFMFNGCQGNENQFDSPAECWSKCKMPDFGGCAGQAAPAKDPASGQTMICGKDGETKDPCPEGFKCMMMAFHGLCCPKITQDLWYRNYKPGICANGRPPIGIESASVPMVLLGKKCADEFCPLRASCHQQEIFAHCCPPKP